MEGNAGAVVPDEESEPERTGSESGTISGRDWSTTSSLPSKYWFYRSKKCTRKYGNYTKEMNGFCFIFAVVKYL